MGSEEKKCFYFVLSTDIQINICIFFPKHRPPAGIEMGRKKRKALGAEGAGELRQRVRREEEEEAPSCLGQTAGGEGSVQAAAFILF